MIILRIIIIIIIIIVIILIIVIIIIIIMIIRPIPLLTWWISEGSTRAQPEFKRVEFPRP